jgi:uncharacterized protein (DUF1697 family)
MRYVALLRGINVGGNTKVPMPELKHLCESLGFKAVKTYINSGNVAFDLDEKKIDEAELVKGIEDAIEGRFGLRIQVMVREQKAIDTVLSSNPFDGEFESHKEMHVLFMKEQMPNDKEQELLDKQTESERFAVHAREIYCHLKLGVADSLLGKGFIEKKLKVAVTGRNWRTVQKLAEM